MFFEQYKKFFDPLSLLNPSNRAIASIKVDFPTPFSPTKKVTFLDNFKLLKFFTSGMEKGY